MLSVNVLILIYIPLVFGLRKELCNLDNECLTEAVRARVYKQFVDGVPGVESSDPLSLDTIIADIPNLKYKLTAPTLVGMRNCNFLKLKVMPEESIVTYELICPHLIIESNYEVDGQIDAVELKGTGHSQIIYENLFVNITGNYEIITGFDGKLHFHIIEFGVTLDLLGLVTQEYSSLAINDKEKFDEYSKKLEELTRDTVMQKFLKKYVHNLQDFQRTLPIEQLHYRQV